MKYKLIVDNGKPYELSFNNKEMLFNKLLNLENEQENNDFPYLDIVILKGDKDITEKTFNEYNFKKERVGFLKWKINLNVVGMKRKISFMNLRESHQIF